MRTTKGFRVVKSTYYFNNITDFGHKEEELAMFDNLTDAQWFCEDHLEEYVKNDRECLEIEQCFNEDNIVYVRESYSL